MYLERFRRDPVLADRNAAATSVIARAAMVATRTENVAHIVVTPDHREAADLAEAIRLFVEGPVRLLDPWDVLPFEPSSLDAPAAAARVESFSLLSQASKKTVPPIIVASAKAIARKTCPVPTWQSLGVPLSYAEEYAPGRLKANLCAIGYVQVAEVSEPGEFAARGGILDLFTPGIPVPVRIEWDGDLVESIRAFEIESQRSTGDRFDRIRILPPRECVLPVEQADRAAVAERIEKEVRSSLRRDKFLDAIREGLFVEGLEVFHPFYADLACLLDAPGLAVTLVDRPEIEERLAEMYGEAERESAESDLGYDASLLWIRSLPQLDDAARIWTLPVEGVPLVESSPLPASPVDSRIIRVDMKRLVDREDLVCVVSGMSQRVRALLKEEGFAEDEVSVEEGTLMEGAHLARSGVTVVGEADFFGRRRRRTARGKSKRAIADWGAIRSGEFVVHIHHGVGIYRGIERIKTLGEIRDVILIEYAGGDRLYLPPHETGFVERYTVAEGIIPKLDKLGAAGWAKIRERAERETAEIARELLDLYALRHSSEGRAFDPAEDEDDFARSFGYDETEDQDRAITEVLQDLAKEAERVPMDRLLCGDVGLGNTEVALRAAFRVVRHGRQVAVLCPTTILALQHTETFRDRLDPFGIQVGTLSRFQSTKEIKTTLEALADGRLKIVIGTHKLLGAAVKFRDLGLVVIDEEQRFGVRHKEKLKTIRKQVDVLTMTATPIPRTLHLALSGARTLSLIETPPPGRAPIQTIVEPFNEEHVRRAIRRELDRDGQIFYVHNQIETIGRVHDFLRKMFPKVAMEVAHGRMKENDLEGAMKRFLSGETAILISTAIVENGLDIPRANTMIVDRAERFGLSALYQLRGRVGRSKTRAYAYFFHGPPGSMSQDARARLAAIAEHTALGAGYAIARRDMEIRGAGEILGASQSGEMEAVGYDMYCRLLREAIVELRGGKKRGETSRPTVDLILSAFLPFDWLGGEELVSAVHREISATETVAEVDAVRDSLVDRFGPPPEPVENLLALARLRAYAALDSVELIIESEYDITIRWRKTDARGRAMRLPQDLDAFFSVPIPPLYIRYADGIAVIENIPRNRTKIDWLRRILRR